MTKEEKIQFIIAAIQNDAVLLSVIRVRVSNVVNNLDDTLIDALFNLLNQG